MSCGIDPNDLKKTQAWLNGPEFFKREEDNWPKTPNEIKQMPDKHLEWRKDGADQQDISRKEG